MFYLWKCVFIEMLVCVFVLMWNLLFVEICFCVFVDLRICGFVEMCDCLFVDLWICVFVEMWFRANFYNQPQKYADVLEKASAYSVAINYNQIVMSVVSLFHSSLTVMTMRSLWL